MFLNEQYTMYQIAHQLVLNNHYEVLNFNELDGEIWLEKYENKTSSVVRLVHKGFDWKNRLKEDIARVFQRTKSLRHLLIGKNIEVHNVYISSHAPVDDWEILRKPMQLNEKKPIKMSVYYFSGNDFTKEKSRLYTNLGALQVQTMDSLSEVDKEEKIDAYKSFLVNSKDAKKKEAESILSYGKPFFTYVLLLANILMFFVLESAGDSTSIENLIEFGAKYNPAIIEGEWWRIISSMFLHIGFLHLFMNMMALFYLGSMVERIFGVSRFIFIYFMAGIGGGLASFAFTTSVSAGASGAIFGLFGALMLFGLMYKKIFFQTMGRGILVLIAVNIVFGFVVPQIDNGAHLGGLITGFIAAAICFLPKKRDYKKQFLALIIYLSIICGLVAFGTFNNENSQSYQLMKMEGLIKEEKYEDVVELASAALDNSDKLDAPILFQRSYAYIELNQIDLAIEDLEKSIQLDGSMPEAHYNLALLYYSEGKLNDAEKAISQAYEMDPDREEFTDLYEEITGNNID
ncbi:rhomboid family intramembrane serine protease [Virgibacillus sp. C22-A2]|uniref:Rhomboid family intramembrane serine protease n=1 Tax=Virgibacillus tibetensis TaxID=3042313 RepID=A0ABU6KAS6_9BACI|nr:rhomboid family intramembrane serine protease [Virgibacillus sp. C22-A2]